MIQYTPQPIAQPIAQPRFNWNKLTDLALSVRSMFQRQNDAPWWT